jgi:hypothetical protein
LVNVITKSEVPPALIVEGVNDFATTGRLAVTVSVSLALQTPDTHKRLGLVLVTLAGTVIEAVLVIKVCANAVCAKNKKQKAISANKFAPIARTDSALNKDKEFKTLKFANDRSKFDVIYYKLIGNNS